MITAVATAQEVIEHHVNAFVQNDIEEIMKDYVEQSFLCTPDGKVTGLDAIRSFFVGIFKLVPNGESTLNLKQMIIDDDLVYLAWSGDSPVVEIPIGTDSFEIKDGKIIWQTLAAHIVFK